MSKYGHISPADKYNEHLLANTHPHDWVNPTPADKYNLVVIGAGTAGLVAAAGAAGLGAKVALVERHLLGGDCLNYGCVPSKCLIRSARAAASAQHGNQFGIHIAQTPKANFSEVMQRMRRLRSQISENDSARRFSELGVDIFLGEGKFIGPDTVDVSGAKLRFSKALIATGARAFRPAIEGLDETHFLTNETVFSLTELPARLAVLGAGPLGCELAQTFARLGSEVTLLDKTERILPREDPEISEILAQSFEADGIKVLLGANVCRAGKTDTGKVLFFTDKQGQQRQVVVDEILVGAGRVPNVDSLGLDEAGVSYDSRHGVEVNDCLRTANRRIYAAGDVCLKYKFTHTADATARIVLQNALFWSRKKVSALTVPWCTFTDPEIAHVGLNETDARRQGIKIDVYLRHLKDVDRAIADGETAGLVKIITKARTDVIIGATIVASHAGEMISELTLAMVAKVGLGRIANIIHPYPTQAEAIRQLGDQYNRTKLTPFIRKLFERILAFRR